MPSPRTVLPPVRLRSLGRALGKAALAAVSFWAALAGAPSPARSQEDVLFPEVVVSATRLSDIRLDLGRIPAQIHVITEKEIAGTEANAVPEVLQHLPGMTLYQNVGNAFQPVLDMRGFSAEPVTSTTVILDGVRVNTPDFNTVDFELIPVEDLERIEVRPGTAAIFGKNALAGVVNLTTRRGGKVPKLVLKTGGGSFGHSRYRFSVGGPLKGFDYHIGLTQQVEDGFREDSDVDLRRLFTKVGRRFGDGGDVTLSYLFVEGNFGQAGSVREDLLKQDRGQNPTPGDFSDQRLHAVTLNARKKLPAGLSAALNGFVRDLEGEIFVVGRTSVSRTATDTLTGGTTAQVTHQAAPLGRRSVLTAGVEYTRSGSDSEGSSQFTGFSPSLTDRRTEEQVLGLYVQESLDLVPDVLILTFGGRYDRDRIDFTDRLNPSKNRVRTFKRFNPRAGLNWNPTPALGFYFSYSEGFRAPTSSQLFAFAPFSSNPDLEPPKSRTYEVGARVRLGGAFEGSLTLFQTDVRDDIFFVVTDPDTGGGLNQNVAKTRRRGLEATLKGRYGKLADGFINYSFIHATVETDVLLSSGQVREGNDIPLVPRHRLGTGVSVHPLKGLTVSLKGLYAGAQRLSGDEPNLA
ncbi:MAG: TonB-dependent receptor, partial [Nitrospinota bacterium]